MVNFENKYFAVKNAVDKILQLDQVVDLSKNNLLNIMLQMDRMHNLDPFHTTSILSFEIEARQLISPPKQSDGAAHKISNQI